MKHAKLLVNHFSWKKVPQDKLDPEQLDNDFLAVSLLQSNIDNCCTWHCTSERKQKPTIMIMIKQIKSYKQTAETGPG